jgi:hypothetical protein
MQHLTRNHGLKGHRVNAQGKERSDAALGFPRPGIPAA